MSKKLDSKEVELFLLDNLDFFETRESLVSEMSFKHSSSSASSILERQVNKLREDHKSLINMLTSFMETASINEDLFNKSKNLTLQILESSTKKQIIDEVEKSFIKDFKVDKPLLKFHKNKKIDELEKSTGLSFHKGAIHCGSLFNIAATLSASSGSTSSANHGFFLSQILLRGLGCGNTKYCGQYSRHDFTNSVNGLFFV